MGYSFEFDEKNKLVIYRHSGLIERHEIGEAWQELLKLEYFTRKGFNLVSDYRGGLFAFSLSDTGTINQFLYSIRHIINGKKEAVIADDPVSAAISMLYEVMPMDGIDFQVRVFSTEEAAMNWITAFSN